MIEKTPDGSLTVFSAKYQQHYHSSHGAQTQAQVVYLQGSQTHLHPSPRVLEVGFGVAMNFLTTLQDAVARNVPLHYLAYEFDPIPVEVLREYTHAHPMFEHSVWQQILQVWGQSFQVTEGQITVEVQVEDVTVADFPSDWATGFYLDGFSIAVNPEVWTPEFCRKVASSMQVGAHLATYSAAGAVRRALQNAGLQVTKHRGLTGKREFVTAEKVAK
ncbi:tRNA (5-methylaminomethyl-2-thiouridine)(34)-methyltransferase MnmD [Deinococcus cellulosilyticus]|uniref:MnmC-like methyltransferase domain-containing protein n=1 Tax=Deinococcus cellulosilyticus (strain DSM 18568 / NBRC 106333 / KACC 11606 / 5516J-15) TaxID=1223518 RepID=A0A511NBB2_DEIC1|nr:tRNA (5-methylaminomethyl-2-thiouridine)(34)-methyltransferase MnmD [Deinococcus cellulosilyticus]GEM49808.1 hypothetical protein DC3_54430 [Deinococcus cellulosilyticus NBRC 106333 = KACC 11606]